MTRLTDERITHYWDAQDKLVEEYKPIHPTRRVDSDEYARAWDVYLLFPPQAQWEDQPPAPSYWMHQLWGVDPRNKLDGDVLAREVNKLLK